MLPGRVGSATTRCMKHHQVKLCTPQFIATQSSVQGADQRLSPAARFITNSQRLNIVNVKGTEKRGLISKSDLLKAIKAGIATHSAAVSAAVTPAATSGPVAPVFVGAEPTISYPSNDTGTFKDIPNSNMRKIIAKRLAESKASVPHMYTSVECDITQLMALRKSLKKDMDVNVSVNDLVIKSAALALRDVPEVNYKWDKASGSAKPSAGGVDISVAVATPNGLITPIVTNADNRGLSNISATVRDLATRARDGKLKPEEYQGGSFSISNLGMFGISEFSAVINPPQACILAVGAGISKIVPPRDGEEEPRVTTTVTVQLSADRRVVDEAMAAQYLQVFQTYLSRPMAIML